MTTPNTTPPELTWTQIWETKGTVIQQLTLIWNKLTTTQKISIAVAIFVVSLLIMFRYEIVPTNRMGVVIQHDRWTGTAQICVIRDGTLKCRR